jgi:hypothetical protein
MIHRMQVRRWIIVELLAARASRGHRTLCLPFAEEAHRQIIDDPARSRRAIDDRPLAMPELFSAGSIRRRIPPLLQTIGRSRHAGNREIDPAYFNKT